MVDFLFFMIMFEIDGINNPNLEAYKELSLSYRNYNFNIESVFLLSIISIIEFVFILHLYFVNKLVSY